MKEILEHLGCEIVTVSSTEECLRVATPEQNVIFMDVSVPGVDGYVVAVRLHEKFRKRHERPLIVALTGNTDKLTKETCRRVGLDGVVVKPVSVDKMRSDPLSATRATSHFRSIARHHLIVTQKYHDSIFVQVKDRAVQIIL